MQNQTRLIYIFLFVFFSANESFVEKYAILIGLNNYDNKIHLPDLAGSVNDVRSIKEALFFNDFKDENIHLLIDKEATKENVCRIQHQTIKKLSMDNLKLTVLLRLPYYIS